jgi:hypothetical protein
MELDGESGARNEVTIGDSRPIYISAIAERVTTAMNEIRNAPRMVYRTQIDLYSVHARKLKMATG